MLGVDFEVHEPPELAEHLRALAGRLRRDADRSRQNVFRAKLAGPGGESRRVMAEPGARG